MHYIKDPKTGKQQTVKSPNEHGNTLGNQPAERYKLVDRKTGKPLKSGETTHGESQSNFTTHPQLHIILLFAIFI
jgi:hypothetical protein